MEQLVCIPRQDGPSLLSFESTSSIQIPLGSYRAAIVPVAVLTLAYVCGTLAVWDMPLDPRTTDWLLMSSPWICYFLAVAYVLLSVVWGPNFMQHRPAYPLKKAMIAYNTFQVIFSLYIFLEGGLSGWFFDYSYICQPCDYSNSNKGVRMAHIAWWFLFSKLVDFMDTFFFVANKKWSNISVLHVVHHSSMCVSCWFGIKFIPGGHITFMGFLNSFVHVVMYTYYLLAACGPAIRPYLWWKKYLTTLQLVQFVGIFVHSAQHLFLDCPSIPIGFPIWTCIYAFIFFALFIDFYYKAYLKPKPKIENKPASNGHMHIHKNGTAFSSQSTSSPPSSPSSKLTSRIKFKLDSCLKRRS